MGRHEQREQVFLLLFRAEFHSPEEMPEQVKLFFENEGETEKEGEAVRITEEEAALIGERCGSILARLPEIDALLNEKTEKWNTKRIGKVELAVLRIALYEMLFDDDIPQGVAIDEAVTIAKKYGQESSGAFVNGVLAKFAKQGDYNS